MENLSLLKDMLMSNDDYWVVAKKNEGSIHSRERFKDSIMLICLPYDRPRGLTYDDIKLSDLEKLRCCKLDSNIFLNEDYPPFQQGQTLYSIYKGYPIKGGVKQFLIEALTLGSSDLWQYKELLDRLDLQKVETV